MPEGIRGVYPPCMTVIQRLRTTRFDATLALAFVAVGLVQVAWKPIAEPALGVLYVAGSMLPLAWRRTRPVEAALVSSAFWLIPLDGYPVLGFVAVILQFFALGSWGASRSAVVLVTLWATVASVVGTLLGPEPPVAAVGGALAVAAPVLAGRLVRHQRQQSEAFAELAAQLREEQRRVEEVAVDSERARIAQELHDVVGHEVTLIAIQAEAAASALRSSPERAVEPVEAIRTTAHRTLAEIRGVLDLLAPHGQPGAMTSDGLSELAQRAEEAGVSNSLDVIGRPWPGNAPAVLAVNRIVRECLTNAGRHAPGKRVDLRVTWAHDHVEIRSTNPAVTRNGVVPGRGLTGIRHRAELLGGSFRAEVREGRFDVEVSLPATASAGDR
jgi:signal transduction histidine kinase